MTKKRKTAVETKKKLALSRLTVRQLSLALGGLGEDGGGFPKRLTPDCSAVC